MIRTHTCDDLRNADVGKNVTLVGWARQIRDHGGVIFIDLVDRYGSTQVVYNPDNSKGVSDPNSIKREYVIQIIGEVRKRPEDTVDTNNKTGDIEVIIVQLTILNKSKTPPFEIIEQKESLLANEDIRLKFRYLDLRRKKMINNFKIRHDVTRLVREFFWGKNFLELETPLLVRSSPEGSREFVVPSRVHPGKFYALPQSPQMYKQLLMVASFDCYFQIAKCLRDEDLRADRQPEFTQIDTEMSFVEVEDIYKLVEELLSQIWKKVLDIEIKIPFLHISYNDAMARYGSEQPDLRFDLEIIDITDIAKDSDYTIFKSIASKGGFVGCINAKKVLHDKLVKDEVKNEFNRKNIDKLIEWTKEKGAKGLSWMKMTEVDLESNIIKYFQDDIRKRLIERTNAEEGDLLLYIADEKFTALTLLGQLRLEIARKMKIINQNDYNFIWVDNWPLLDPSPGLTKSKAMRHPFTKPKDNLLNFLDSEPEKVLTDSYDIILNGIEIGSGSLRIHDSELQNKILKLFSTDDEKVHKDYSFLLTALKYGAPPHGGIGLGLDRIIAILTDSITIREVILFPTNKQFQSLLDSSPSTIPEEQLKEISILVDGLAENDFIDINNEKEERDKEKDISDVS